MLKRIRKAWNSYRKKRPTLPLHPFVRSEGMRKLSDSNIRALNAAVESSSPVSFSIGIGYFPSEPIFPKRWVQRTKQGGFLISLTLVEYLGL